MASIKGKRAGMHTENQRGLQAVPDEIEMEAQYQATTGAVCAAGTRRARRMRLKITFEN